MGLTIHYNGRFKKNASLFEMIEEVRDIAETLEWKYTVHQTEFPDSSFTTPEHDGCIMTNHVHLIFRSVKDKHPANLLGDFKRFTSKAITKAIQENPQESRKEFLMERFKKAGEKSANVKNHQFWRHDNKPIELWSNAVIREKIDYIHRNPVEAGLVFKPEHYRYSSAVDYSGEEGLVKDVVVFRNYG